MPHHDTIALTGVIEHVFAHRFTVLAEGLPYLADLGPKGAEAFALSPGLEVALEGERRPSEIKVLRIRRKGGKAVMLEHKKPHHGARHDAAAKGSADPAAALVAVAAAGWEPSGVPQPHPKHFEVLARQPGGAWMELHVDFNGGIYKQKPATAPKWPIG